MAIDLFGYGTAPANRRIGHGRSAAIDGEAAVLDDDERSEAIVDLLQKRMGKNKMRAYRQWDGSRKWERI